MDLVILAGTIGQDASWTHGCPRPLLPLAGTTLLERLLATFEHNDSAARAVCANGHADVIARHLAGRNVGRGLMIVEDGIPRGTAGCLKACESLTGANTILLVGASVWFEDDPEWLLEQHRSSGNALTVFCASDAAYAGSGFARALKPAGIYCCDRAALEYIRPTGYQDLKEQWVPVLREAGLRVGAVTLRGGSCEVSDWSTYIRVLARSLSDERLAERGYRRLVPDIWCGEDVEIAPQARIVGPALLGHGCKIEDGAVIVGPVILGNGSHVGRNSWLVRVVAAEGVRFPPGSSVTDRLISPRPAASAENLGPAAAANETGATSVVSNPQASGRRSSIRRLVPAATLWGLILTGWFIAAFRSTLAGLWEQLSGNADYSAGLLVPLAAAYMAATRCRRLAAMTPTFWWMGAAVFLTGIAVNLGGTSLQQPLLEQLGMLACANGVVMAAAGRSVYRAVWYPLAFLVLMLPLPSGAHEALISPLRELTAQVSATLLETLGVPTVSSGQVMSIGGPDSTAVIEAAGGLRMVLALLIVIGVGAFIIERPRWQKVVVVLSSVPIALVCNALRIVAAGYCHAMGLDGLAQGMLHGSVGLLMMPAALLLIALECWVLANLVGPRQAVAALLVDRVERHQMASQR
jgi:exosortase